jgi:hypothetical protein
VCNLGWLLRCRLDTFWLTQVDLTFLHSSTELLQIIFIPRGSRPLFGRANRLPLPSDQRCRRPLQSQGFDTVREDSEESTMCVWRSARSARWECIAS